MIGVISQPTSCISKDIPPSKTKFSYIPKSYVSWIQSAGGRVVPIPFDLPESDLDFFYSHLNGVVFPGGWCSLGSMESKYIQTQKYFFDRVVANNDDDFFIWGTCQGFESISILGSGENVSIIHTDVPSMEKLLPLHFLKQANETRLFERVPDCILETLKNDPVTFNWHNWGIRFPVQNEKFNNFFDIITINEDSNGNPFVSTIESKSYNIWGTQWHPEIFTYEDHLIPNASTTINFKSVQANQYFSLFFVMEECKKSTHSFSSLEEENQYVIDNYSPLFVDKIYETEENRMRSAYFFSEYGYKQSKEPAKIDLSIFIITTSVLGLIVLLLFLMIIMMAICLSVFIFSKCFVKLSKNRNKKNGEKKDHYSSFSTGSNDYNEEDYSFLTPSEKRKRKKRIKSKKSLEFNELDSLSPKQQVGFLGYSNWN